MTLQNAPPGLDYDRDRRFSKVVLIFLASIYFSNLTCVHKDKDHSIV